MAKRHSFISLSFPSVTPKVLNSTQRYISGTQIKKTNFFQVILQVRLVFVLGLTHVLL